MVGEKLGPFEIDKELGSGAMGTVYRARYSDTGQVVAIKMIAFGMLGNEQALERFEREANILKQMRHKHIVRLFATGRYRKTPFFAMEFVEGESLDHVLERKGRLAWEEVVNLGVQLCDALQHAHDKGVIHRDLKPANIMILHSDGTVKLTDFGIAKDTDATALTGANSTVGTAAYMSPEQCRGDRNLTAKSDLYSLGVVFYELLTGRKPFIAESPVDMFMKHVNEPVVRPSRHVMDIPPWLDTLVCQLMEKRPEHRPRDAAMVAQVLTEIREKAESQASVGADIANTRRADTARIGTNTMSEEDVQAAKSLRAAKKKKKSKDQNVPLFERTWFRAVAVLGFLGVLVGGLYFLTRPPAAASLLKAVESAQENDDKIKAIEAYLSFYGKEDNDDTKRMRQLELDLRVAKREGQLLKRYGVKMKREDGDDSEAYDATFTAFDAERDGNLRRARESWNIVIQRLDPKNDTDSTANRAWAGVARKHIRTIDEVEKKIPEQLSDIFRRRTLEPDQSFSSEAAKLVYAGYCLERYDDPDRARGRYEQVKKDFEKKPEESLWLMYAASRVREIEDVLKGKKSEELLTARIERLTKIIRDTVAQEAEAASDPAVARTVKTVYRDLDRLYGDDPNSEVRKLAAAAKQRLSAMK